MTSISQVYFGHPESGTDVQLKVFSKVFHVHSLILSIHSEKFQASFNWPDKNNQEGNFKSYWISEMDGEGLDKDSEAIRWLLKPAKDGAVAGQQVGEKGDDRKMKHGKESIEGDNDEQALVPLEPMFETKQEIAFEKLFSTFYGQAYTITDFAELKLLVALADYFRALPILSRTLSAAFDGSPEFTQSIPNHALALLPIAAKVRSKQLFKDCIVHLLGPWEDPQYRSLEEPSLKQLADSAYKTLCVRVLYVEEKILAASWGFPIVSWNSEYGERVKMHISRALGSSVIHGDEYRINLPEYFRGLYDLALGDPLANRVAPVIAPLLKSKLALDKSGDLTGQGLYASHFLCPEILDEDLPWDVKEKRW